jgi:O-antigen ligase
MMGLEAADSHNIWIGILAEGGLLGFFTYLYLCYAIAFMGIRKLRDPKYQALRPILFGYLGYHFFCFAMSYHYFTKAQGHLHFLMIGLLLGIERGVNLKEASSAPARLEAIKIQQ